MKHITNECVDCGLPCFSSCPYKNVTRFYCDKCGNEDKLRRYNGKELCADCLLEEFEVVEGSDY